MPYIKALRPHQWSKNLLVFLPAIAAHDMSLTTWVSAFLAFASFSFAASSAYVLNDLLDLEADRRHPRKRNRPLASGALTYRHGVVMAIVLLLLSGGLALAVGRWEFAVVVFIYYLVTLAYSLYLKRKIAIDICTLAGLYTLRIIAGAAATGVEPSVWLLAFSIFLFMSLAAVKRQVELVEVDATGSEQAWGRSYLVTDLPIVSMVAIAAGYVAVLVLALYLNSSAVQALYSEPRWLWVICGVLLYWITRLVIVAQRGGVHDDPIVFAFGDRASYACGFVIVVAFVASSLL